MSRSGGGTVGEGAGFSVGDSVGTAVATGRGVEVGRAVAVTGAAVAGIGAAVAAACGSGVWLGSISGANVAVGVGSVAAGITSVGWADGDDVCVGLACARGVFAGVVAVGVAKMTTSTSGGTKGAGLWQATAQHKPPERPFSGANQRINRIHIKGLHPFSVGLTSGQEYFSIQSQRMVAFSSCPGMAGSITQRQLRV